MHTQRSTCLVLTEVREAGIHKRVILPLSTVCDLKDREGEIRFGGGVVEQESGRIDRIDRDKCRT